MTEEGQTEAGNTQNNETFILKEKSRAGMILYGIHAAQQPVWSDTHTPSEYT